MKTSFLRNLTGKLLLVWALAACSTTPESTSTAIPQPSATETTAATATATETATATPTSEPTATRTPGPTARPIQGMEETSRLSLDDIPRENAFFIYSNSPDTFDPALSEDSAAGVAGALFSGLVRLDTNLQPIPDLAERWEISADGTVYTFHLRQNVTFHTGRAFTAEDVKYSWERAANPKTGSPTVLTYMNDIVGLQAVIDGESTEISGVSIIDEYTLEVSVDAPKAYFLYKLAFPTSWIVDHETINTIEENPIGTGPFSFTRYDEDTLLILSRNVQYHGDFVPLEYLVLVINPGSIARAYEAGEIDLAFISEELLGRASDESDPLHGQVLSSTGLCTTYMTFDAAQAPFDDPLVREAFARAIDKEDYNEVIFDGSGLIADGLYPPGLPGYSDQVEPLSYDLQAAQDALVASSYADGLPDLVFTVSGFGGSTPPFAAYVIDKWEAAFDVNIDIEFIDPGSYLEVLRETGAGQISFFGWCADYPDPENFADVLFHSQASNNLGHYNNPEADALLEEARAELDIERRLELYRQIEQILIDDAAVLFLLHTSAFYELVKPYVSGYVSTPIGVAQFMNIMIVPE